MAPVCAFVLLALISGSSAGNSTTNPAPTPSSSTTTKSSTSSTAVAPSQPVVVSTIVRPANNTGSVVPTASVHSNATSPTILPTKTVPTPTATAMPTTQPKNGTTVPPTSTSSPTTNGVCPTCKALHREVRAKWVGVAFAIIFGVATVVMTVLYCRQRKIYRELEGDSSLSRLI